MNLRNIILTLLAITLISSCSKKDREGLEANSGFWSWFEPQQSEFVELFSYETGARAQDDPALMKKTQDTVMLIGDKLREIHPEFSPFFRASEEGLEMTITVHGQAEHFEAVDKFIASAPEIAGWTFIALKNPLKLSPEAQLSVSDRLLTVGEWRYSKTKNSDGSYDFIIYLPVDVSESPESYQKLFSSITKDFL